LCAHSCTAFGEHGVVVIRKELRVQVLHSRITEKDRGQSPISAPVWSFVPPFLGLRTGDDLSVIAEIVTMG
jgi:hypothetical protein